MSLIQFVWRLSSIRWQAINPSHKSHYASNKYRTMHQFVTNVDTCSHFCFKMVHCGIWVGISWTGVEQILWHQSVAPWHCLLCCCNWNIQREKSNMMAVDVLSHCIKSHEQPYYWLYIIGRLLIPMTNHFNYLLPHFGVGKWYFHSNPVSKVHGANMAPTLVLSAPDGSHAGPMTLLSGNVTKSVAFNPNTHHEEENWYDSAVPHQTTYCKVIWLNCWPIQCTCVRSVFQSFLDCLRDSWPGLTNLGTNERHEHSISFCDDRSLN